MKNPSKSEVKSIVLVSFIVLAVLGSIILIFFFKLFFQEMGLQYSRFESAKIAQEIKEQEEIRKQKELDALRKMEGKRTETAKFVKKVHLFPSRESYKKPLHRPYSMEGFEEVQMRYNKEIETDDELESQDQD